MLIYKNNNKVLSFTIKNKEDEILGINDRIVLVKANKIMNQKINKIYMLNDNTFLDSDTIIFDDEVK